MESKCPNETLRMGRLMQILLYMVEDMYSLNVAKNNDAINSAQGDWIYLAISPSFLTTEITYGPCDLVFYKSPLSGEIYFLLE